MTLSPPITTVSETIYINVTVTEPTTVTDVELVPYIVFETTVRRSPSQIRP
jgi:hypothetical protein